MSLRLRILIGVLAFGLASCNKPIPATPTPSLRQNWIDAPLHDSTIPMGMYTIVYHGASASGIDWFEVRIDGSVLDETKPKSSGSGGSQYGTLFMGESEWLPWALGTYWITVSSRSDDEIFGAPVYSKVTVLGEAELLAIPPPAILSPTATIGPPVLKLPPTPILAPTSTPTLGECIYTALANLFCRTGPGGSLYPAVDSLVPGQSSPVLGLSPDGFFAQIEGVNNLLACYVPLGERYGILSGACDDLPTLIPPPPPPSETPQIEGCTQRQSGGDIICVHPCPDGAVPGEACIMP